MNRQIAGCLLLATVWSGGALAADSADGWYLSPMLAYTWADTDRSLADGVGYHLSLGKAVTDHFNLELRAIYTKFDLDRGGRQRQLGVGVDALYFFDREGRFEPYLLAGGGLMQSALPDRGDDGDQAIDLGVGFLYRLNASGLAWRTDVRFRNEVDTDTVAGADGFADWVFNTGLTIPFGQAAKVSRPRD